MMTESTDLSTLHRPSRPRCCLIRPKAMRKEKAKEIKESLPRSGPSAHFKAENKSS
jgi:hypothetical protein